jgi:peroxisome-assembly ATPase
MASLTTPKGLLLTGPPGSGKSFLVTEWFDSVPTPYKIRKHYNELVLEIYRAVWEETQRRMALLRASGSDIRDSEQDRPRWTRAIRDQWRSLVRTGGLNSIWSRGLSAQLMSNNGMLEPSIAYVLARRLVLKHWLLVFDEVQLLDVSSAGLLADVLSWYWRMGGTHCLPLIRGYRSMFAPGVVVGTSNKIPDDLYKNGVQRERLEPFVEALKARSPVLEMRSTQDWRKVRSKQTSIEDQGSINTWFLSRPTDIAKFNKAVWTHLEGPISMCSHVALLRRNKC